MKESKSRFAARIVAASIGLAAAAQASASQTATEAAWRDPVNPYARWGLAADPSTARERAFTADDGDRDEAQAEALSDLLERMADATDRLAALARSIAENDAALSGRPRAERIVAARTLVARWKGVGADPARQEDLVEARGELRSHTAPGDGVHDLADAVLWQEATLGRLRSSVERLARAGGDATFDEDMRALAQVLARYDADLPQAEAGAALSANTR
jgi:hypothetical protein